MNQSSVLPEFLSSYDALHQHIRAQLEGENTTVKGKRFAQFVQRLLPQTEFAHEFGPAEINEKASNDKGVDLIASSHSNESQLLIQSKLFVDRAENIDSILSKFQAYQSGSSKGGQDRLFDTAPVKNKYLLVTLSQLDGIRSQYERTPLASKTFYEQCKRDDCIHFIDGVKILQILKTTYSKLHQLPTRLELNLESPYIQVGSVFIGVLSTENLRRLYEEYGDALFFENVRDFLGIQREDKAGRTTPNNEIVKTIVSSPDKLLARNNGIVLGARLIEPGCSDRQLILNDGSVVNGCQTTMCVVESNASSSFVLIKAVQTDDAWDITKTANYQTSIPDIDLELARFLRPQLVKRAAANLGIQLDDTQSSAFQVLNEIYDRRVAYAETRLLYIGLFSRTPNNVFASNYAELQLDLIKALSDLPEQEEQLFDILFTLQGLTHQGLDESKKTFTHSSYAQTFERLYREDSLTYRCFLTILAICGAVNTDITRRDGNIEKDIERVGNFLTHSGSILKGQPEVFLKFFKYAVKVWMAENLSSENESEVRQQMFLRSKQMNFSMMFKKLCLEADLNN